MINLLALTTSPAPEESAPLTLQGAWDAVVYGVSWFFGNLSPAFVWAILGIAVCVAFFAYYWWCLRPRPHSLEWIAMSEERAKPRRMTLTLPCHPMERRDILPVLLLAAVYAFTAFFRLGDFSVPQSPVKFQQGESVEFSYDQPVTVDRVSFYPSLGTGYYTLEWQDENGTWQGVKLDPRLGAAAPRPSASPPPAPPGTRACGCPSWPCGQPWNPPPRAAGRPQFKSSPCPSPTRWARGARPCLMSMGCGISKPPT